MEKRRRERIGEDSPKAALRSEVRKFSARAVNAGGKQNKATPPTWLAAALVRHDRFFLRSTRRLRLREGSIVAQLFPPPLVSAPPEWGNTAAIISEETRTGRRCAREFRAHLSSFRRVAGRLCRENNQGDTADVARGPLGSPWSVFFPLAKSTPTENYPWRLCQESASCRFFARSGSCPRRWPWRLLLIGSRTSLFGLKLR